MNTFNTWRTTALQPIPGMQTGFSLIEVSVAMMVVAAVSLGYLYNQSHQSALSLARTQAGYYQMVNGAVSKYMTSNYNSLKGKSDTCAKVPLITDSSAPPSFNGCGIEIVLVSGATSSVKPIANGLQPSLRELVQAGYLSSDFNNVFLWPTAQVMKSTASEFAAPEFRVQISRWCNGSAASASNNCDVPDLRSLVFNAQPFAKDSHSNLLGLTRLEKLLEARSHLGANGLIAYDFNLQSDGVLYSEGNQFKLTNPLQYTSGSLAGNGLEGVLALQGYYQLTPIASPTPSPDVTKALPFSECNPQKDTIAEASASVARVAPIPNYLNAKVTASTPQCIRDPGVGGQTVLPEVWLPTLKGQVMTCKKNDTANNYISQCRPPDSWRTCVTSLTSQAPTTQMVGKLSAPFQYVVSEPRDDLNKKPYCWQPTSETIAAVNSTNVSTNEQSGVGVIVTYKDKDIGPVTPWDVVNPFVGFSFIVKK